MNQIQWARLVPSSNLKIRRGAWYRILKLGPVEAIIDIKGKPTPVPRAMLQIAYTPPNKWTVLPAPRNVARFPSSWGTVYAVCPSCRERAALEGHPTTLRCHRCNGLFEVGWNDASPVRA